MQEKEIKVWFAHLSNGPITYHRMVQFAYEMSNKHGIYPVMTPFQPDQHDQFRRNYEIDPDGNIENINQLAEISDMIVVQSITSMKLLCYFKAYKNVLRKILISEYDDNPFEVDSNNQGQKMIGPGTNIERNSYDQLRMSDHVICSTDYLSSQLSNYKKNTHTIPNAIDFRIWDKLKKPPSNGMITIGWSGGAGHFNDLKPIREPLKALLEEFPYLEICFLHGLPNFIDHPRFRLACEDWVPITDYPKAYCDSGFDIVIAPIRDTEFNRCKSNLRYLEASALKIPVVASNVEPYKKTIENGVNGYLFNSPKEFLDILRKLVKDVKLRESIGLQGYDKIKKEFCSEVVAQKYADLLKSIFKDFNERLSNDSR